MTTDDSTRYDRLRYRLAILLCLGVVLLLLFKASTSPSLGAASSGALPSRGNAESVNMPPAIITPAAQSDVAAPSKRVVISKDFVVDGSTLFLTAPGKPAVELGESNRQGVLSLRDGVVHVLLCVGATAKDIERLLLEQFDPQSLVNTLLITTGTPSLSTTLVQGRFEHHVHVPASVEGVPTSTSAPPSRSRQQPVAAVSLDSLLDRLRVDPASGGRLAIVVDGYSVGALLDGRLSNKNIQRISQVHVSCQDLPTTHSDTRGSLTCAQTTSCVSQWAGWAVSQCVESTYKWMDGVTRRFRCHASRMMAPAAILPQPLIFDGECPKSHSSSSNNGAPSSQPLPRRGDDPVCQAYHFKDEQLRDVRDMVLFDVQNGKRDQEQRGGAGELTSFAKKLCSSWDAVCDIMEALVSSIGRHTSTCGLVVNFASSVLHGDDHQVDVEQLEHLKGHVPPCVLDPLVSCVHFLSNPQRFGDADVQQLMEGAKRGENTCSDTDTAVFFGRTRPAHRAELQPDPAPQVPRRLSRNRQPAPLPTKEPRLRCDTSDYHQGSLLFRQFIKTVKSETHGRCAQFGQLVSQVADDNEKRLRKWRAFLPLPNLFPRLTYGALVDRCVESWQNMSPFEIDTLTGAIDAGTLSCDELRHLVQYVTKPVLSALYKESLTCPIPVKST